MIIKNQAVFTVKEILHRSALIQYVVHDNDNDWQFLPGYEVPSNDMMIVSIEDILGYDESITQILSLEIGYSAFREHVKAEWIVSKVNTLLSDS